MSITLDKNSTIKERQEKILALQEKRDAQKRKLKKEIVERTFGSVQFDPEMTALEIQKEMRNNWD